MLEPRPTFPSGPVPSHPLAAAGLALILLAMGGCGEWMTGPTSQLHVSVDEVRLWVGETLTISASITASDGAPIAGPVTWSSETTAVVVNLTGW